MEGAQEISGVSPHGILDTAGLRCPITPEDRRELEERLNEARILSDGEHLVRRGEEVRRATILLEGYLVSSIVREGKRFIVGVHVPGDFVDLHGFVLKHLDHDIASAGSSRIVQIDREKLDALTLERPQIVRALWFATLLDSAVHRQWIRNLEALDAPQRIAHLFAELRHRLLLAGHTVGRTLRTPFTQTDLADMCGVSAIHANRAVARLRELGLGEIRRGALYIGDWTALENYARFDPTYLYEAAP